MFDFRTSSIPIDEKGKINPIGPYALSKYSGLQATRYFRKEKTFL